MARRMAPPTSPNGFTGHELGDVRYGPPGGLQEHSVLEQRIHHVGHRLTMHDEARALLGTAVMRVSINGSAAMVMPSVPNALADLRATKAEGFSGYWLAQVGLCDALTVFAAARSETAGIEVGTAVIPTFPRHPHALAAQALTTQAAIGGRLILGIGLSHQPSVEGHWKMKWERPIRHMSD